MEESRFVHSGFCRMARGLNPPPWNQGGGKEEALSVNEKWTEKMGGKNFSWTFGSVFQSYLW